MRSKPDKCYEMGCPLAVTCSCGHHENEHPEHGHCTHLDDPKLCECNGFQSKGRGFVLGVGDPVKAQLAIILEAPGKEEISFPIDGVGAPGIIPPDELERRKRDYPEISGNFLKVGAPVVGKSGSLLNQWVLPRTGFRREEIFIDNTIRCLPPNNGQGQPYPTKDEKAAAESCCRVYDRVQAFNAQVVEVTLHPAGILREVTPLPLLIKDMEKASSFIRQGFHTLVLMGGKAAGAFLGYAENVSRWRGHYEVLTSPFKEWYDSVVARLSSKKGKGGGKVRKLGKAAAIDLAASGLDILDTPSLPSPKFKRSRRVRCKVCRELGGHKNGCSERELAV